MKRHHWLWAGLILFLLAPQVSARGIKPLAWSKYRKVNRTMHGTLVDFTCHHGRDNRIWSPALCQKRDMYVYLPPCFDARRQYPLVLLLHGFIQDESSFLTLAPIFDRAILAGELPPVIIAAPDGSIRGRPTVFRSASFFINSRAGNFEDYLMQDVVPFLFQNFPIRPEREAHVISGASMGGTGAFIMAFKYPDMFKHVVGIFPALNLRWVDCHNRYRGNFDPDCWGWRTRVRPHEVVGNFYGVVKVRSKHLVNPLFGHRPDAIDAIAAVNPIEMLDLYDVRPGQFDMFVAYGGKDEFNIDAQVESFLYCACGRGLEVDVRYNPRGRHNVRTGIQFLPEVSRWILPRLAPYSPPLHPEETIISEEIVQAR